MNQTKLAKAVAHVYDFIDMTTASLDENERLKIRVDILVAEIDRLEAKIMWMEGKTTENG